MKKVNYLMAILIFTSIFSVSAQTDSGKILKVEYETNNLSEFLIDMLKSQIKDPKKYSEVLNQISQYKIFHTLYYNPETSESLYVMDSIHEVKGVSTVGHVEFVYNNSDNAISGKEIFMGKTVDFKDQADAVKWVITNEKQEIMGFEAVKATLETNPDIVVWFTPEIAAKTGPYIYTGLPGLVLESHGIFNTTTIANVEYLTDNSAMVERRVKGTESVNEGITFNELLTKKKNFQAMASKGKNN